MTVLTHPGSPALPVEAARSARPRLAAVLVRVGAGPAESGPIDIVDQWGEHSFPASDPPANW